MAENEPQLVAVDTVLREDEFELLKKIINNQIKEHSSNSIEDTDTRGKLYRIRMLLGMEEIWA